MYSWWNGRGMGYIEARIEIYCKLYAAAVKKTQEWGRLKKLYEQVQAEGKTLAIFDFDGHNSLEILDSFEKILYNYKMKMGHGFVLAMMLKNERLWETEKFDERKIHYTKIPKRKNNDTRVLLLTTLYISNVSENVMENDIREIFGKFGVVDVRLPKWKGKNKGFGFVTLESHEQQQQALLAEYVVQGRQLTISEATQQQ